MRYLVEKGYLARAVIEAHGFSGSPAPNGRGAEYSDRALAHLGEDGERNQKIVDLVQGLFDEGHKRVIAFTPSVDSAEECAAAMRRRGYLYAHSVSGKTPSEARDSYTRTFQQPTATNPNHQALFNCNVLTAGFDAPETSAAVIGQPTKSAVRLQQMVGRALRGPQSGGTKKAVIHMIADESYSEFADLADMFCQWESLWEEGDRT
ncbi:MAG: helicase-related protein [Gammaproteobacteria bacterium]|nr:helicase-related protein [Gammaproteobacteria bacterium]